MDKVEDETIGTVVPILFVEFPNPFDWANLGSCKVLAQRVPSQKLSRASVPVLDHARPRTHEAPRARI